MIEFTIKTLDSNDHDFTVEDDATVRQVKELILREMGIAINMQRLIFGGRVLTDDRRLSEFDVGGKVIHLVPRPPPSSFLRNPSSGRHGGGRRELRDALDEAQRVIDRMATQQGHSSNALGPMMRQAVWSEDPPSDLVRDEQRLQSLNPVASRLEMVRRTIDEIRHTMGLLQNFVVHDNCEETDMPPAEPMETDVSTSTESSSPKTPPTETTDPRPEADLTGIRLPASQVPLVAATTTRLRDLRTVMRPIYSRSRDLADLVEELDMVHTEFAPFRGHYLRILRDTAVARRSLSRQVRREAIVKLACNIMHSFAHAYHAVSDISFDIAGVPPCLNPGYTANRPYYQIGHEAAGAYVDLPVVRPAYADAPGAENLLEEPRRPATWITASMPLPVTTANSRTGENATAAAASTYTAAPTTTAAPTETTTAAATETATAAASETATASATAAPTSNAPVHGNSGITSAQAANPEPITYQVEIETRVPIALPIDTTLLTGLASVASHYHPEVLQNHANQHQASGQGQPQNQSQTQSQEQTAETGNRPRVLMDIENLLRSLSQSHPGLEVVMSMEEIHEINSGNAPAGSFQPGMRAPTVNLAERSAGPQGSNAGRVNVDVGTGINVGPNAGATGVSTGTVTDASAGGGFGGSYIDTPFGQFQIPVLEGTHLTSGTTFNLADSNVTMNTPSGATYRPESFTIHSDEIPEGGVFIGPIMQGLPAMPNNNEFFQNVISHMLRQPLGSTNTITFNPATTHTITSNSGTTHTVTSNTETAHTVPSNTETTHTVTSDTATPRTSDTSSPRTSNTGTTHTATSNASTAPMTSTNATSFPTLTLTYGPAPPLPGGPNFTYIQTPNVSNFENVTTVPQMGQDRLGPLSAMARARTMQQVEQRRRNTNPNAGRGPERHRQSNARMHHLAMAHMVYDRALPCDSTHAFNSVAERRSIYQLRFEEQNRLRRERTNVYDIDLLRDRNSRFTTRHMAIMMRLLSGPLSAEGRLNAFMVTVARMIFMDGDERILINRNSMRMPREYLFVRMQMREYIQRLVNSARAHYDSGRSVFDVVVAVLLTQNMDFLDRMHEYTPIIPNTETITLLRNFLRRRIPAIIALVLSDSTSEVTMVRFFNVFTSFYKDLCKLVLGFCVKGFSGLRALYEAFINHLTREFQMTSSEWIRIVAIENLLAIRDAIEPRDPDEDDSLPSGDCCRYHAASRPDNYRLGSERLRFLPRICEYRERPTMMNLPPMSPTPTHPRSLEDIGPSTSMSTPPVCSSPDEHECPQQPDQDDEQESEDTSNEETSGSPPLEEDFDRSYGTASDSSLTRSAPIRAVARDDRNRIRRRAHNRPSSAPLNGHHEYNVHHHHAIHGVRDNDGNHTGNTGQDSDQVDSDEDDNTDQDDLEDLDDHDDHNEPRTSDVAGQPLPYETSSTASSRNLPDSTEFVAPAMLLEHWGEEWVPVFTRDQRTQRERDRPQEPHSDAYLSGMPSRKRRCVRASRPPTTLDGFITESVRGVTERTVSLSPPQVREVVRDTVRTLVRARAQSSEEYNPERYAAAARFIQQDKPVNEGSDKKTEKVD